MKGLICQNCGYQFQTKAKYNKAQYCQNCREKVRRSKTESTNFKRYGCKAPAQNTQIKDKVKKFCLQKYGVESTNQLEEVKRKKMETSISNYGVTNPQKSKEVRTKVKQTCLSKYGVECSLQDQRVRQKGNKTILKRYGCQNVSQNQSIKEKKRVTTRRNYSVDHHFQAQSVKHSIKQTNLDKYGCENPSQNEGVKRKKVQSMINHYGSQNYLKTQQGKQKVRNTCLDRYGVECVLQSSDIRKRIESTNLSKYGSKYPVNKLNHRSKLEQFVQTILIEQGIQYQSQYDINRYSFDFKVGNILIQVNGDYWHANPQIYQAQQYVKYPRGQPKMAKQVWEKDQIKKRLAQSSGYKVVYLWQKTINSMDRQDFKKYFRQAVSYGKL